MRIADQPKLNESPLFLCSLESDTCSDPLKLRLTLAQTFYFTPTAYISQMIDWIKYHWKIMVAKQSGNLCEYEVNNLQHIVQPAVDLHSSLPYKTVFDQLNISDSGNL